MKDWRVDFVDKSAYKSYNGSQLHLQDPYGGSRSSATLVSGNLASSSGLCRHQAHMKYTYEQKIKKFHMHKLKSDLPYVIKTSPCFLKKCDKIDHVNHFT